ncbi:MAG: response regulator [Candidatus Obscuribacterales bacterium]|nr:response regulator [Steroidobacteraceae bacterium]
MTTAASLRVLLVEDSKVLADRLTEVIGQSNKVELTRVVETEADAVAAIRHEAFDVVILDLYLKQGNGFEVMRTLASSPSNPRIVIFTNHGLPEYQTAALSLGATYFLDKARDYERLPLVLQEIWQKMQVAQ